MQPRLAVGFILSCAAFGLSCDLRFAGAPGFWLHTALRRVWLVVRFAHCRCAWLLASYRLAPRLAYSVTCALPTRPTVGFISPCAAFDISHDLRFAGAPGFWLHTALRRVWLVVRLADAVCHASQGLLSVSCFAAASHNCLHCVQSFAYSAVCRFEEQFSAFAFPGHVTVLPRSADFAMPYGLCS